MNEGRSATRTVQRVGHACLVSNSVAKGLPDALHQQLPVEPVAHEDASVDGDAVPRRRPALVLGLVPLQVHDDPADGGRYEACAAHADQRADLLHLHRTGRHAGLADVLHREP